MLQQFISGFGDRGRVLPKGLELVSVWVDENVERGLVRGAGHSTLRR
jgi:hypothetical protein